MSGIKVTFLPIQKTFEAEKGETLLDVALRNDVPIQHACGGYCACTTCHVKVKNLEALGAMESDEEDRLEKNDLMSTGSRLACQAKIMSDVEVEIQNLEL